MKKIFLLAILVLVFSMALVCSAGVEHGINGHVSDADDGTIADGSVVVFYIEGRADERLTDIVGADGNSKDPGWYSVDIKNFPTPWDNDDKLIIMIMKDELHAVTTEIIIDAAENKQQAPNTQLGQCEGAACSYCGDAICNDLCNETIDTCPQDCGGEYCGDLICSPGIGETCLNCPDDCPASECGDGICDCPEDQVSCPDDCLAAEVCNFDNVCDFGENFLNCPDCGISTCGNMKCDPDESELTCPSDCVPVVCGDGICDIANGENAKNCPTDCKRAKCGNGKCEIGENKNNCCTDCGKCFQCCLFGICATVFGLCWGWGLLILVGIAAIVVVLIIYYKKKKKLAKQVANHKVNKALKKSR